MIDILPNWHPIFVHFTIALLSMSVVFYVLGLVFPSHSKHQTALTLLAKVNLYIGVGFAIITAIAGWFAYNSVNHDTPSHLAMTEHRNLALLTLAVFLFLALWSLWKKNKAGIVFVGLMVISGGLLSVTGWMGGEAVYRYGLGVMSMPKVSGEGHAHQHADGEGHGSQSKMMEDKKSKSHEHAPGEEHEKEQTETKTSHDEKPHGH